MECIEQTLNGSYSAGGRQTCTISRNGDLLMGLHIQQLTASSDINLANPGYTQFSSVEVEIGGQRIDKQTGDFMNAWAELTESNPLGSTGPSNTAMAAGTHTQFQRMALAGGMTDTGDIASDDYHFIPLQFWFCRNPGLALPLIALQLSLIHI